ncbi:MAG TPA: aldo/keto reductase [Polyangia bacterium]|jgi:methylglyoxal reductase|nr:aldo/keto reductase [Polyangia bacterium]
MESLPLGRSPVTVSRIVHGCMSFADDDGRAVRAIHAAFDAGVTTFDTAPLYGFGRSEELLAKAIADRRGRLQILTKVGLRWDGAHGRVLFESVGRDGTRRVVRRDSRAASIRQEVDMSLRRLGVDVLDLVQVHHRDLETPLAETMAEFETLTRAGKIRAVGVSNFSRAEIEESSAQLGPVPLAAAQLEYSLLARRIEADALPWARDHTVAVLAYSPLAHGALAGRQMEGKPSPPDWRRDTPCFDPRNVETINRALAQSVVPLARSRGLDLAQVCLAWVLSQPGITAAIVGASSPAQAIANAAAADARLSPTELELISASWRRVELAAPTRAGRGVVTRVRSLLSRLRDAAGSGRNG